MRPHTGPQQQQQPHHPQQYCAIDNNNLKQQQHFAKNHQGLQQHISQQQTYHQHQLQQHVLHQQQPPPPAPTHMWNPHLGFTSQPAPAPATANPNVVNSSINLQSCRPFPNNRLYQHPTHAASHYPPANGFSQAMPAKTQGSERMPLTAPNYAKLPPLSVVNQQRINECAGIPLISTASAHLTPGQRQRISRKQSHSPPAKSWPNMLPANAAQNYAAASHYAAHAHVQGAPLMLNKQQPPQMAEYWTPNAYATSNHHHHHQQQQHQQQFPSNCLQYNGKQHDRTRTALRYQNSAPAALVSTKSKENLAQQLKHSKDNDKPSSTNGDSSNSNEACLPRIIKPRKRRKKDRKPPNSLVNSVYLKMDNKSSNTHANTIKSNKSPEDLLKCLEKFNNSINFNEQTTQRSSRTDFGHVFENSMHQEPAENISHCTADSTNNHGICFCNGCDPLRSLWDYPLKRSLSDSSASVTSGTGSLSDNNAATTITAATTVDYNWPKARAEVVGVIGSKRNKDLQNPAYKAEIRPENKFFHNNILGGINLASELFKQTNYTAYNKLEQTFSGPENILLLPETAETLLTKSINEISKKLIETCSNETNDLTLSSCNSSFSSSFSNASTNSSSANSSCADFSNDSGIESAHINAGDDLVFNFDNLHITRTKLSLSPSFLSSSVSLASASASLSSSSSSSSSSSTSSCGNLSMSSSPTVKFTSNFLTTPATAASTKTTPLTPNQAHVMGTTMKAAPTLDFLLDLNNNHLHVAPPNAMINTENQQKQQQLQKQRFNDLLQNHQPPEQQQQQQQQQQQDEKLQSALPPPPPPPTHQHDQQQFFNNCFDLMWQHNERQLGNNNSNNNNKNNTNTNTNTASNSTTNTSTTASTTISTNNNNNNNVLYICNNTNSSNRIEQLTSSTLTSNNVAMSSFLDSLGSLKAVFSTLS